MCVVSSSPLTSFLSSICLALFFFLLSAPFLFFPSLLLVHFSQFPLLLFLSSLLPSSHFALLLSSPNLFTLIFSSQPLSISLLPSFPPPLTICSFPLLLLSPFLISLSPLPHFFPFPPLLHLLSPSSSLSLTPLRFGSKTCYSLMFSSAQCT